MKNKQNNDMRVAARIHNTFLEYRHIPLPTYCWELVMNYYRSSSRYSIEKNSVLNDMIMVADLLLVERGPCE